MEIWLAAIQDAFIQMFVVPFCVYLAFKFFGEWQWVIRAFFWR